MLWLPCSPECEALNVKMLLHLKQNECSYLEKTICMLIASLSWSAGATERERKEEKKERRRRGKGRVKEKREEEDGKRTFQEVCAASPKKQSRSPITPRKQFWTTPTRGKYISSISTDFSKSLAPRPRLQPTIRLGVGEQQSSVAHLLDRTTYVCQHLLIISGDLSAG